MKSLGEKIRYYRNLKNWSQEEIAHKLDISLPAYSKIERNLTDLNFSRLKQIARVLGISPAELISSSTEQHNLQKLLHERDKEIIRLQKQIISLIGKKKKK